MISLVCVCENVWQMMEVEYMIFSMPHEWKYSFLKRVFYRGKEMKDERLCVCESGSTRSRGSDRSHSEKQN